MVRSVCVLDLRRHRRSRRTAVTVLAVTAITTAWALWDVHLFEGHQERSGRSLNFHVTEATGDRLFLELAHHPIIGLFLVCFAVLAGADTLAKGREDGSVRTLQSLPYDRRSVFFGAVLARVLTVAAVVTTVVVSAFLWARLLGYTPSVVLLIPFTVVFTVHVVSYVCIGVALSTLERRRGVIHAVALLVAIGSMLLYVPLSNVGPETAVLAPRQVLYAQAAALDGRWNLLSGLSTRAAVASQLLFVVVPLVYGLYRYERCDLGTDT